ncbi:sigma 54-interacting transcriptional regulator [Cytobacillus oceanisediminis]|uniref:Ribonuclease R-like protein with winged-helix domain n=1 Tax=Cytobacillus oceanisediminis TaxID=665099 RepID=A0A562K2G7_9BACI|nr:sigma 54-interacting transcriptional regulator [Cytobacillus oceanisediminis]TWH89618.1 ribonuclease R-like protein with winged-helix domain [Cytobacillus oceanisediminis]
MSVRKVHIIAIQEMYLDAISKQVKEVLGDKVIIQPTTIKDLHNDTVASGDLVLLSNKRIQGIVTQIIPKDCPCIIAKRDINVANTKELLSLPSGQTILVVNDTKTNTSETIQSLQETFFEHTYIPYSPEETIPDSIDYIITPGERHLLPRGLLKVIDIGPRLLNIDTFQKLNSILEIDTCYSQLVKRYIKSLISLSDAKNELAGTNRTKEIWNTAMYRFEDIVAVSKSMRETVTLAKGFAKTENVIHVQGDAGTGKSMLAQAIHNESRFSQGPFVSIYCSSRDYHIIERELFGSESDESISLGLFEIAGHGSIYIKEIGELPLFLQRKICRVLREKEFSRIGGSQSIPLQARVITSNTKALKELVNEDALYPELYYLLSPFTLKVPSLLERKEDFISLIENIKFRIKRNDMKFTNDVMNQFMNYEWGGNVKELYNVISYLSILDEPIIDLESLPIYLRPDERSKGFVKMIQNEMNPNEIISKIEEHGFLDESLKILRIFCEGKKNHTSYGRLALKKRLEENGMNLSEQQLRMRLEVLQELDLLIVRQGRAGSTISRRGEEFLEHLK